MIINNIRIYVLAGTVQYSLTCLERIKNHLRCLVKGRLIFCSLFTQKQCCMPIFIQSLFAWETFRWALHSQILPVHTFNPSPHYANSKESNYLYFCFQNVRRKFHSRTAIFFKQTPVEVLPGILKSLIVI